MPPFYVNYILQRVSGTKLSHISSGDPFPFHAVSLFTPLLSAFCRYVIMVWKGRSQTFHRAPLRNKAGVWELGSGSAVAVTVAANYRDRHQWGTVIFKKWKSVSGADSEVWLTSSDCAEDSLRVAEWCVMSNFVIWHEWRFVVLAAADDRGITCNRSPQIRLQFVTLRQGSYWTLKHTNTSQNNTDRQIDNVSRYHCTRNRVI